MIPIIYGPTGVGKTELLVEVCEILGCEIISMDSRQIYRYMDIGTAKPSPEQRKRVFHHMIDILDPDGYYNAYLYRKDSLKILERLSEAGKRAVFVGGTGLYVDALVRGIFEGVPADENIRRELRELEKREPGMLRKMLEDVDPESAIRIHPNDLKRTIRALEVYMLTGKRISDLRKTARGDSRFRIIVLLRERKELYERINRRVDWMIENGLVEEVKRLLDMGYSKDLNSLRTIGYKETIDYLEGSYDFQHYVHILKRNTRHFARRQIIWSRRYENALKVNLTFEKDPVRRLVEIVEEMFEEEMV